MLISHADVVSIIKQEKLVLNHQQDMLKVKEVVKDLVSNVQSLNLKPGFICKEKVKQHKDDLKNKTRSLKIKERGTEMYKAQNFELNKKLLKLVEDKDNPMKQLIKNSKISSHLLLRKYPRSFVESKGCC
ncbi:hypothetical protein LXL04_034528 [Taraxacum kok-saghyz]